MNKNHDGKLNNRPQDIDMTGPEIDEIEAEVLAALNDAYDLDTPDLWDRILEGTYEAPNVLSFREASEALQQEKAGKTLRQEKTEEARKHALRKKWIGLAVAAVLIIAISIPAIRVITDSKSAGTENAENAGAAEMVQESEGSEESFDGDYYEATEAATEAAMEATTEAAAKAAGSGAEAPAEIKEDAANEADIEEEAVTEAKTASYDNQFISYGIKIDSDEEGFVVFSGILTFEDGKYYLTNLLDKNGDETEMKVLIANPEESGIDKLYNELSESGREVQQVDVKADVFVKDVDNLSEISIEVVEILQTK